MRRLHPRRGTDAPTSGTPPRRPGSLRRTTTIDMLRPDGPDGELHLVGRARELLTRADGSHDVMREASLRARVEPGLRRSLRTLDLDPGLGSAAELIGRPLSSGFRAALDATFPGLRAQHSLLYQLLDDLPTTALVSGHALAHGSDGHRVPPGHLPPPDLCAGWQAGGTLRLGVEREGRIPITHGPAAPSPHDPGDPLAWHRLDPLPASGMRRHRLVDVSGEDRIDVEAFFRDAHMDDEEIETVVHEYTVQATFDPRSGRFEEIAATPRVLPWLECPAAAASAGRLRGTSAADLRKRVRREFVGPSTCTHLNDTLRALEDVPELAAVLAGRGGTSRRADPRPTGTDR